MNRIMMIGLDGFETNLVDAMIAAGKMPALAKLRSEGAGAALDHGEARRTGLAWEHVSTGLSPADAGRWAAVDFESSTYRAVQRTTRLQPFTAQLDTPSLIFDVPYFDLAREPQAQGVVGWGAHDPGVALTARPKGLLEELKERFGDHPARNWIYGMVWPDPRKATEMGRALANAVDVRFAAAEWLFGERFRDWRLGMMVVGESHSASEALWHGIDTKHPLNNHSSAPAARAALENILAAADRGIARLVERLPDTSFVIFNLHGMGPNDSDAGSMVLLAELMFRRSFGRPLLAERTWATNDEGIPLLTAGQGWESSIIERLPALMRARHYASRAAEKLGIKAPLPHGDQSLAWMPAGRYAPFWPSMEAFALPSYYDGQIRINLVGREGAGLVASSDYVRVGDEIEAMLRACTDPLSGKTAVAKVLRNPRPPLDLGPTEADLIVVWKGAPLGLAHQQYGTIGPIPYRRTGGHTGGDGFAWFAGPGIPRRDLGRHCAFDLVPTVVDLLGHAPIRVTGSSFASKLWPIGDASDDAAAAAEVDA